MKTTLECGTCFVRQAVEAIEQTGTDQPSREAALRRVFRELAEADWSDSPPVIGRTLHRIIREATGDPDPYRAIKSRMNAFALGALPSCREAILTHGDPHEAIVRMVVAANLLDAGAKTQLTPGDLPGLMASIWDKPLAGDPAELFRLAGQAERILYLADNAGEIIFDRLLLEVLPPGKTTVAVRGLPILNDALREDALLAGLNELAPIIENGSDAPGTFLADCSEEFLAAFRAADLIISKGQGNYETLSSTPAPLFFLFTVKCPLVAAQTGEPVGSMIAKKSAAWAELNC